MNGVLFNNCLPKTCYLQIQLIVIDIQLNNRLLKSSILGHMTWVDWTAGMVKIPIAHQTPEYRNMETCGPTCLISSPQSSLGKACASSIVPTGGSGGRISIITYTSEKQKIGFLEGLHGPRHVLFKLNADTRHPRSTQWTKVRKWLLGGGWQIWM